MIPWKKRQLQTEHVENIRVRISGTVIGVRVFNALGYELPLNDASQRKISNVTVVKDDMLQFTYTCLGGWGTVTPLTFVLIYAAP